MANKLYEEKDVARIAKSLNTHSGDDRGYKVSEMADGIDTFVGGIKHRLDDIIERQGEILDLEMAPESPVYDYVSEGLEYSFNYGSYEVIGRGRCNDSVIVIPETYDDGKNGERRVWRIYGGGYMEGQGAFENDQTIEEIVLPESRVGIYWNSLRGSSLKILRNYSGGDSFWSLGLNLKYVSMIDGTNIENFDFYDVSSGVTLDFSRHTSVPTLSDVSFITAHEGLRILVPEGLYDEWVSENSTNWVALKDYIYPVTVSPEKVMDKIDMVEDCVEDVYEKGKQAEHDAFWDAYQQNGTRTDYQNAFVGAYWNDTNFKPKYDIAPVGNAAQIFNKCGVTDVKGICEAQGIAFDFSKVNYCNNFITDSQVTRLPIIDAHNILNCSSLLTSARSLVWVDGVILSSDDGQNFGTSNSYNWTLYSGKIEHLPILGGVISTNCYFNSCTKFDKESLTSIINALDTTEGRGATTLTLSKTAVNKAFETSDGANDGAESDEFNNLCASARSANWTISLI